MCIRDIRYFSIKSKLILQYAVVVRIGDRAKKEVKEGRKTVGLVHDQRCSRLGQRVNSNCFQRARHQR